MKLYCFIIGLWCSTNCYFIENAKAGSIAETSSTGLSAVEELNEFQLLDASNEEQILNEIPFDISNSVEANFPVDTSYSPAIDENDFKELEVIRAPEKSKRSISSVTEKTEQIRQEHAKELLGHKIFKKSSYAVSLKPKAFQKDLMRSLEARLGGNKKLARKIQKTIFSEAKKYRFDPIFIAAIIQTESSFNPKAEGTSGEVGLMQLMPETALWIAQKEKIEYKNKKSLLNPVTNIKLGVAYMAFLRDYFKKNPTSYIAAYNMGARNVKKLIAQSKKPKVYPVRVLKNYKSLYASLNDIN